MCDFIPITNILVNVSPFQISSAGTYGLCENLNVSRPGAVIEVNASNVVLTLNNFQISNDDDVQQMITVASGVENVRIVDGILRSTSAGGTGYDAQGVEMLDEFDNIRLENIQFFNFSNAVVINPALGTPLLKNQLFVENCCTAACSVSFNASDSSLLKIDGGVFRNSDNFLLLDGVSSAFVNDVAITTTNSSAILLTSVGNCTITNSSFVQVDSLLNASSCFNILVSECTVTAISYVSNVTDNQQSVQFSDTVLTCESTGTGGLDYDFSSSPNSVVLIDKVSSLKKSGMDTNYTFTFDGVKTVHLNQLVATFNESNGISVNDCRQFDVLHSTLNGGNENLAVVGLNVTDTVSIRDLFSRNIEPSINVRLQNSMTCNCDDIFLTANQEDTSVNFGLTLFNVIGYFAISNLITSNHGRGITLLDFSAGVEVNVQFKNCVVFPLKQSVGDFGLRISFSTQTTTQNSGTYNCIVPGKFNDNIELRNQLGGCVNKNICLNADTANFTTNAVSSLPLFFNNVGVRSSGTDFDGISSVSSNDADNFYWKNVTADTTV